MMNIKKAVESYLKDYPPALELFRKFSCVGDVYLIGGVLREFRDKQNIEMLRDADFIIDVKCPDKWKELLQEYKPEKNHFDGYKFYCTGFLVDVWEVENTWAYRENIIVFDKLNYLRTLPETVFLNMDSIIYDMKNDIWYDEIYQEAKRSGILDVVLEDNPHLDLNILRAMILKRRYKMSYSNKLKQIIKREVEMDNTFIKDMLRIQEERYHDTILSEEIMKAELDAIIYGED